MSKLIKTMLHPILKACKIGFWFFLPLVLISNTHYDSPLRLPVENGEYLLKVSGSFDTVLTGHVFYTEDMVVVERGIRMARVGLELNHAKETVDHVMRFAITKHAKVPGDLVGVHQVSTKAAGIANNLDGIFGFADIDILGEQPFFTNYGTVAITHIENGLLHGNLNLTLRNIEGQKIFVSGSFIAADTK